MSSASSASGLFQFLVNGPYLWQAFEIDVKCSKESPTLCYSKWQMFNFSLFFTDKLHKKVCKKAAILGIIHDPRPWSVPWMADSWQAKFVQSVSQKLIIKKNLLRLLYFFFLKGPYFCFLSEFFSLHVSLHHSRNQLTMPLQDGRCSTCFPLLLHIDKPVTHLITITKIPYHKFMMGLIFEFRSLTNCPCRT